MVALNPAAVAVNKVACRVLQTMRSSLQTPARLVYPASVGGSFIVEGWCRFDQQCCQERHFKEGAGSMEVTESGIAMRANDLHPQKALSPNLATDSRMVMLSIELQKEKARSAMVVTESGIVMLANELQKE